MRKNKPQSKVKGKQQTPANKISLRDIFKTIAPDFAPSDDNIEFISSKLEFKNIDKGDFFAEPGNITNKIGIQLDQNGILKAYRYDEKGEKKVSRFFYSPHNIVVSSFESFRENIPTDEYIEAVTNVWMMTISRENLLKIYKEIPAFNMIGRILAEENYINALNRLREMQTLKGDKRVENFYRDKKFLMKYISANEIASYLGLSRNIYSGHLKRITKLDKK